ncbi:Ribonuclease H-like domain [Cinara cedri]|uniref:Ribonuclease H-like domain n=1 Tax=Cinara cedri TaxID=506608 RepID=A0A5E4NHV3_9HEMI|nr:Ribonuclease H-like domain [Cinara cedri]
MSEDHLKWPHLKTHVEQQLSESDRTEKKKSNFLFKFMPKIKLISTSTSSNSNLKTHIKVMKPIATGLDVLQVKAELYHYMLHGTLNIHYIFRFKNYMQSKTLQVSSALVPKFKLIWADSEDRNTIKQHVINHVHFHCDQNKNLSSPSSSNLETNSEDVDDFFSFSNDEISVINFDFQTLVTNYLSNTNIKVPLELKKVYIEFNTSSAPVERLFSAGGQLFDKRRRSFSDQNFEISLLLKYNKYFQKKYKLYFVFRIN